MTGRPYSTAAAMRDALEQRLRAQAAEHRLPLDRLRKQAALQRLLARLAAVSTEGSWCLKGGMAMIARVGPHARATADADATWRAAREALTIMLEDAVDRDMGDHFEFLIGTPTTVEAEGDTGGLRFPIESRMNGRRFERLRLDVNLSPGDTRPTDLVVLPNVFDFAHLPDVTVPAIPPAQQLAEKLHAYTRNYGTQENSRAKDLYDMLVIAAELPLPHASELARVSRDTYALRTTPWPPVLSSPPPSWTGAWSGFVEDYRIGLETLDSAFVALQQFWTPVLAGTVAASSSWRSEKWRWA